MILKKPYAYLIKHFRTIHIILTLLAIFVMYKTSSIITFFQEFIANNYSVTVTDTLVKDTISSWIYIGIVLIIGILITVYILLKKKKKPTKTYLSSIIYYIILLIFIFVAAALIGGLEKGLWPAADARTYRDFARIIYLPQLIFIILLAIRALGFNVKQFNFKSDLKEMEITEADSEEIELNINFQTYKAERKIRRFIREFKYYFLENKLMFIAIASVIVLIFGFLIFKNAEKLKYTYKEGKTFNYNNMKLTFLDSMITNVDQKGNIIYPDKYFVLAKVKIKNGKRSDVKLDYNNFKLYYGFEYVYPVLDLGNHFQDFGDPYMGDVIRAGEEATYVIPYIIDARDKNSSFKVVLYLGEATKSEDFLAKTATIKLKPTKVKDLDTVRTANMGETISLASSSLSDSSIMLNNYEFATRYEYNYESCYKEECRTYTDVIAADNTYQNRQTFIILDYDLKLDSTSDSYININDLNAFASSFIQVEYTLDGEKNIANTLYKSPPKLKDKLVLQTTGKILDAEEVNLLITIRNRRYVYRLV